MKDIQALMILGWIEGASYLTLLLIAMPLKYFANYPEAVSVVGAAHGGLFMAFIGLLFYVAINRGMPFGLFMRCGIGAVVPLGPLLYEKRLKQLHQDKLARQA